MTFNIAENDALLQERVSLSSSGQEEGDTEIAKLQSEESTFSLQKKTHTRRIHERLWKPAILFHVAAFLGYSLAFIYAAYSLRRSYARQDEDTVFVPYHSESMSEVFEHRHSIYVGRPSEELDKAWEILLQNANIRITDWEMSQFPGRKETAVSLPDGGYFASPNVYHNLHCIQRLYKYMYEDHYFPNITEAQKDANEFHNHHCLDMLRQSIMCAGDMQLLTMKWTSTSRIPHANSSSPHKCVNWEKLDEWASSRMIKNLMKPGYLMHPTLGPAYPEGKGSLIGEAGHLDHTFDDHPDSFDKQ